MKKYFELIYWAAAIIVMSLIFVSFMGSFGAAFFLSVMLLPGILFVKYFRGDVSFWDKKRGIQNIVYFISIALLIEYLAIALVYWSLYHFSLPDSRDIILNPVFILFLVASLLSIEMLLKGRLTKQPDEDRFVTFISDRTKISLRQNDITYIESRDYEVLVRTVSGESHATRMKISQWEAVLGENFIRVHRSFIVNRSHITKFDSRVVYVGGLPLDISRKYKAGVLNKLGGSGA